MDETLPPAPDRPPANLHTGRTNGHEDMPDARLFARAAVPVVPAAGRARARGPARRPWPGWERLTRLFLAFTIASLLWFYVLNLENPATSATFTLIPVTPRGLAQNLSLGNDLGTVTVTAQATQDVLARLSGTNFSPTVDLAGRGPGTYQVPVQIAAPGNVLGVTGEPAQVQVQVIEVSQKTFPIQVRIQGVPALGYQVETQQVRPTNVQVQGPREQVARIDHVAAEVDVQNRQGTQQGDVTPRALDFAGHEIPGLVFNPQSVTVVIAIQQLLNYKTLPIHVPVEGVPAAGYGVTDIVVQPTTFTAYGSPTLLEPLNFLETAPVAIGGATQTVDVTVPVSLTNGLILYPPETQNRVQVRVQIAELTTKTQLSVLVHRNGLAPGLIAIESPDRVDVTLSGPFEALQGLKPDSVQAVIDLSGYGVGTYKLTPAVTLPPRVSASPPTPSEVTVTISALPTATPEPPATLPPSPSPPAFAIPGLPVQPGGTATATLLPTAPGGMATATLLPTAAGGTAPTTSPAVQPPSAPPATSLAPGPAISPGPALPSPASSPTR